MKRETARTLLVLSVVCVTVGFMAHSPSLAFLLTVVAAASAAAPAILAAGRVRIWAAVFLAASLFLCFFYFAEFKKDQQRYRKLSIPQTKEHPPPATVLKERL